MPKVKIDGQEYDTEKLSSGARELLNSILFVDAQLQRLQNETRIYLAARNFYLQELKKQLKSQEG